ncbi:MAG: magnesium transporter CorA, partial [Lachnospiraceae bacterium]|nr:magnesium transporter CorA [Lachnospiraceae bacterium]
MYYLIKETLTPCDETLAMNGKTTVEPFVAVMSTAEWQAKKDQFDMVIDMDLDPSDVHETKAVVNFDSLTGSFYIPSRRYLSEGKVYRFAFALDENGIVLIDDGTRAQEVVDEIRAGKKWRLPSLERFLYDFLERIIRDDLGLIERTEQRLGKLEEEIIGGEMEAYPMVLNDIRGELLDLRVHYEQLIDLGQELEENENGFFREENLRYFHLFTERVTRLQDIVTGQREYVMQLR